MPRAIKRYFPHIGWILFVSCFVPLSVFAYAQLSTTIENFESGSVSLDSYPGQDSDSASWNVSSSNPYGGTYALRLYGNTWKTESISPLSIADSTVWRVASLVEQLGEMQGFGVSDGTNELLYSFGGSQLPAENKWWTVYQGAFPVGEWYSYLLPIGRDWMATYGYLPTISSLIYVNDNDSGSPGTIWFDEIADVSDDQPVPPVTSILYTIESSKEIADKRFLVGVQFQGTVYDPDSPSHTFQWDFGDGETSGDQNPAHPFIVEAAHTYTVGLIVRDGDGLVGSDTCQIHVEPGEGDLPITVNFVGDIFTGRSYESSGGLIDTYGIDALFEPTYPIFGQAADVNVCNLECAYTDRGSPHPTKSVVFRSSPVNIAGIVNAGVDVVTLGNNHIVDYGEQGMLQTIELLDSLGIKHSGAGINDYFALLPTFHTEQGVRLAFLGQCNRDGRKWNYQPFLDAGFNKPGFGNLLPHNVEQALSFARDLADVVIIQLHSGDEYQTAPPDKHAHLFPPPIEMNDIGPDDPDFLFRVEPSTGERELRRQAADDGADIVINHHPHVLQGFESYKGKLIAHSLGNYIFDLYYPETMPTIVLTLEIDKTGIVGYTFTPAWIDDWIPQPATGTLGREIIDRLADYSRPMDALVAYEPESNQGRIYLNRSETDSAVTAYSISDTLVEAASNWTSPPLLLEGAGNVSRISSITGSGSGWEVRWGREILWHGTFEDEGGTFWDDNTADEWLDTAEAHTGFRSLALRRSAGAGGEVGTDLEKHLACDPAKEHSVTGYLKADNADNALLRARFYSDRYSSSALSSEDIALPFTGSTDWSRQWKDIATPGGGNYFEVRCRNAAPSAGTGYARFDDIAFIEWEPWSSFAGTAAIPSPNNFRFVQVRSADAGATAVNLNYEETAYGDVATHLAGDLPPTPFTAQLNSYPNPFNPRTTVELFVPGDKPQFATIDIFDVRGRQVTRLFEGTMPGGRKSGVSWNGKDARGRELPSGIYFARAKVGSSTISRKMILLR